MSNDTLTSSWPASATANSPSANKPPHIYTGATFYTQLNIQTCTNSITPYYLHSMFIPLTYVTVHV